MKKYPSSVDRIPIPAPARTSEIQCLLLRFLPIPVNVDAANPPILYAGFTIPYSLCKKLALVKAIEVCPDGKELLLEPSGRSTLAVYFIVLTRIPIIAKLEA